MRNEIVESDKLYESLNKAFTSTTWMIRYFIYPVSFLLTVLIFLGIWWGVDIRNSKNEINISKQEIDNIQKSLSLKEREINIIANEIVTEMENRANASYESLQTKYIAFESNITTMSARFEELILRYESKLVINDSLFRELKDDNESLEDFSEQIRTTVSKYTSEIEYAKKGIEERKKDIELILQKRDAHLDAINETIVLLTEYLLLVQSGRNKFPDPNIELEIKILNQMLIILIPDSDKRDVIINRLNKNINR